MIVRINSDGSVVVVEAVKPEQEEFFLKLNEGNFKKVDSLPPSRYGCYKLSNDGEIVVDYTKELEIAKKEKIKEIDAFAEAFILNKLRDLDWGETYDECLAELASTAQKLIIESIENNTPVPSDDEAIRLLLWVEKVWQVVEEIEEKIKSTSSFDELDVEIELPEVEV